MSQAERAAQAALIESARRAAEQAEQAELDATAAVAKGRGELELLGEAMRVLPARSRELRTNVQLLREALDRAKLSALNAGLEGARLGDPLGRVLVDLAGDLRDLLSRAVGTLEEHASLLVELDRERDRVAESLDTARTALAAGGEALGRSQSLRRELGRSLAELERQVAAALGTDPQTARLLASAADQIRALSQTLASLAESGAADAVRELVEPLQRAVSGSTSGEKP